MYQVFCAPGPEGEPLPIAPSPWHVGRCARLPLEHWQRLYEFLLSQTPEAGPLWGAASAWDASLSPEQITDFRELLRNLRRSLDSAPPLTPEVSEEILEDLPNWEHQRMLDAVLCVLDESDREPPQVWVD